MSKKRKIFYGIISAVTALSVILAIVAVVLTKDDAAQEDDGYAKTIVYLGDSISEGLIGPSPVAERDSYAFYALVGRSNNYRYIESAVSGDDTAKLYGRITGDATASAERRYWIKEADIIHISILGNDLLVGDFGRSALEYITGDTEKIDEQFLRAREYFEKSLDKVRELNPEAVILVNTLYNPLDADSTLISTTRKAEIVAASDNDPEAVRAVGDLLIPKLNEIVYDYLEENPGAYEIVDVYTAFNNIYKENREDGIRLIYRDWLHPSNEGHAVMASLIQEKLEELNLTDKDFALARYKKIRAEQVDRLFKGTTLDSAALKASVQAANSYYEVSRIYAKGVRGVLPIYGRAGFPPQEYTHPKGETFDTTRVFSLTSFTFEVEGDLSFFMDTDISAFTFNPDGTFTFTVAPMDGLISGVNGIIGDALEGGLDLSEMMSEENLASSTIGAYLLEIFPGLNIRYLQDALSRLASVGIYINGFDFESDNMKLLVNSLEENLSVPEGFVIPEISVSLKGWYFINETEEFTNIHLGLNNVSADGFPFFCATLHTPANGDPWIEVALEVSKLVIVGTES